MTQWIKTYAPLLIILIPLAIYEVVAFVTRTMPTISGSVWALERANIVVRILFSLGWLTLASHFLFHRP